MTNFAIAYKDKDGSGYTENEPYVDQEIDCFSEALSAAETYKNNGYQQVTIFTYTAKKDMDHITWRYVNDHRVKEPTKEDCVNVLENLKNEIEIWDWDFDYYHSGFSEMEDQIAWAQHILDVAIATIKQTEKERK